MTTPPADLRRWIANHQAVNAEVHRERRLLTPTESLFKALQASKLHREVSDRPPAESIEEALVVYRQWAKLRAALLPPHRS